MELKELNHAGEQGVFGSIRVLGEIDSKNLKTIKRDVNIMQNVQNTFNAKVNNYWTSLSDDGIITTGEKQTLKHEWETIQQTYTALLTQATAKALISTSYWAAYQDAYDDLRDLLFVTEKIFEDMQHDTTLTDKDDFNDIFKAYYYQEQFVQVAIMTGLIDKLGLRVLDSLSDPGVEGELAFYKGELYQYTDGAWCRVGTESYLGILDELPETAEENQYFLAGDVFEFLDDLVINDEILYINDDVLGIKRLTRYGYMYYWSGTNWFNVPDEDPRYLAVLADYMTLNGELPYVLETHIEELTENVSEEVARDLSKNPRYLGVSNTIPAGAAKNDWFVYSGTTAGTWIKNRIYRYTGSTWQRLNPDDDANSRYYMSALQDILALEEAGDGYFSTLFCNAFFANKASINALKVQTIYLEDSGAIQSNNATYVSQTTGLKIDASGNIDANGSTHIGGNCTIDGTCVISGNTTIGGTCNIGGNASFSGTIRAVNFELVGVTAGDVVQREYNNIFDATNTRNTYNLCSLTRGTMRIKISYNVTSVQTRGPYIQIGSDKTQYYATGTGTLTKDVSFTEYENIKIIISDAGEGMDGGGQISVSNIQVCLSADDTIFKNFLQFFLIDSYFDRTR